MKKLYWGSAIIALLGTIDGVNGININQKSVANMRTHSHNRAHAFNLAHNHAKL